jgi:hypothetical protein
MQKALITGASSGIGLELAKIMAAHGHDLILVARDLDRLKQVKTAIVRKYNVDVTIEKKDLSLPEAAKELHQKFKNKNIEILVNNAGIGLKGDFFGDDLAKDQTMAYLNMNSLMNLTYYFGGDFLKMKKGKILNVASIVAFFPGPKQPVYYATKAFVRSFSRALAYNMRDSGVTVTALHPGVTKTNFFKTAEAGKFDKGASPKDVALLGYKAMMAGKIEVTHGLWNRFLTNVFVRITPYRLQPLIVDKSSEV